MGWYNNDVMLSDQVVKKCDGFTGEPIKIVYYNDIMLSDLTNV